MNNLQLKLLYSTNKLYLLYSFIYYIFNFCFYFFMIVIIKFDLYHVENILYTQFDTSFLFIIFYYFIIFYLSIILHEFFHAVTAIHFNCINVKIIFHRKGILLQGSTYAKGLVKLSKINKIKIFFNGAKSNFLIIELCIIIYKLHNFNFSIFVCIIIINGLLGLINLMPFKNSDGYNIFKIIKS